VYPKAQTYTQAQVDTLLAAKQTTIDAQAAKIASLNIYASMTI
jgi:hypothetical protein